MVSYELSLPSEDELVGVVQEMAQQKEAVRLTLQAVETGIFHHPDGRTDQLEGVRLLPAQLGLVAHLAKECSTPLSIEVGFGMGSSAGVILAARRRAGTPFAHLIFDPFGLPDGRGAVVENYLKTEFPKGLKRVKRRSEIGLGELIAKGQRGTAGFIFIDGGHRFENVMTDFVLADRLCSMGGYIVLDDAWYPAIETVVNYVTSNRPDYAVAQLAVPNTTVLRKLGPDKRGWEAFTPFEVPQRQDWTPNEAGVKAGAAG